MKNLSFLEPTTGNRVGLGFITLFVILVGNTGSIAAAISLFAISLICTLGASLLFWIPAAYILGSVIIMIVNIVSRKGSQRRDISEKLVSVHNYIKEARTSGLKEDQIINNLRSKGWPESDIKEAFDSLK